MYIQLYSADYLNHITINISKKEPMILRILVKSGLVNEWKYKQLLKSYRF